MEWEGRGIRLTDCDDSWDRPVEHLNLSPKHHLWQPKLGRHLSVNGRNSSMMLSLSAWAWAWDVTMHCIALHCWDSEIGISHLCSETIHFSLRITEEDDGIKSWRSIDVKLMSKKVNHCDKRITLKGFDWLIQKKKDFSAINRRDISHPFDSWLAQRGWLAPKILSPLRQNHFTNNWCM